MLIPITLSQSINPKLPSGLVKISHDEIVLIELQGSLEVELTHLRERDGKFVGKLKIDDATTKPTLLIGHHLLEGKIAPLPKPYAIIVRNAPRPSADSDDPLSLSNSNSNQNTSSNSNFTTRSGTGTGSNPTEDDDAMAIDTYNDREEFRDADAVGGGGPESHTGGVDQLGGSSTGWTIRGIVKKKIIFSKRPMPVIGNAKK